MKKSTIFLLLVVFSFKSFSQITYEKGYFINNTDQKISCLIKNMDWKINPVSIDYKLAENDESKTTHIKDIKEFSINDQSKYIRATVDIDRSSENLDQLNFDRNPVFKKEQLLLKVLIEGKANLYGYNDENLQRYFYNKEDAKIEQLVYKIYFNEYKYVINNVTYQQQLLNNLTCENISLNDIKKVDYKKNDLVSFFVLYNNCVGVAQVNYEEKIKRKVFNLTIRPGLNFSSLDIKGASATSRDTDFDQEMSFRFGLEAEFTLPINKNKWSVIIEPTYQSYKSEAERILHEGTINERIEYVKVDYTSIEIPIGFRYYMFINDDSKLFVNASFIFDISNNDKIDFESGTDLDITSRNNLGLGIGYKYNDKYSLEFRYQISREILGDYALWNSNYNTFSVIIGYSIF